MDREITGVMVYYNEVCQRKLWYFYHGIQLEQENENVKIGKVLDEETYKRDEKHINIDFIRSSGILHEIKKSRKIEEAGILQVKYYLCYLKQKGVEGIKARIDYPLLKKSLDIELSDEDEVKIKAKLEEIRNIVNANVPPGLKKKSICKSCAYFDLCFI